jgi:hypothetical protein
MESKIHHKLSQEKVMKYETPELTALTSAINAIQSDVDSLPKLVGSYIDGIPYHESLAGYMDWED